MTPQEIVKKVAEELQIEYDYLINGKKSRKYMYVIPRDCIMFYFNKRLKLSHENISKIFNMERSTVSHRISNLSYLFKFKSREHVYLYDRLNGFIKGEFNTLLGCDFEKITKYVDYVAGYYDTTYIDFTKKGRQRSSDFIEIKHVLLNFLYYELNLNAFELAIIFKFKPFHYRNMSLMRQMEGHHELKTLKKLWNELNN